MAIASMWASMATWWTPTVLFCVLNLVIATIFIASNFKSHNHHPHNSQSQLARSPSLLERVKSVNFSSFYHTTETHDEHMVRYDSTTGYHLMSQLNQAPVDQLQHEFEQHPDDSARQLARTPSILERVKSIKLYTNSEQHSNSIGESSRVPSLIDQVKSFKLPSLLNSDHHSGETVSGDDQRSGVNLDPNHQDPVHDHNVTSNVSKDSGITPAASMIKSRSEKRVVESEDVYRRRPATMRASVGVHEDSVDAKADDFIRRFKQQLKLQRIDSFKKFREMLNRGTSSG